MKSFKFSSVAVIAIAVVAVGLSPAAANQFADPGFEGTITTDGPPFVGSWEGFNGGLGSSSDFTTNMPRNGAQSLELNITATVNTFAGAFQDVVAIPGNLANFSVWAKDMLGTDGAGIEMRMEYRDSINNVEISRTPNLTPASLGSTYELLSLSDTVPAGADTVRAVFAIQSFGGVDTQQVFVDDAFISAPEPTSVAMMGMATLALATMRRRK